jgi:hypothetical protein
MTGWNLKGQLVLIMMLFENLKFLLRLRFSCGWLEDRILTKEQFAKKD